MGYSPERINPGDHSRGVEDIVKITSGSCDLAAEIVDSLYAKVIKAGTHLASSIKVAEAAKVIENTQRDVNIALMNELSCIFHAAGIKTSDVLAAANTKWNFLPFYPGLVGGHCIGVDPYYLAYKARSLGYEPNLVLAGRRVNESVPSRVASDVAKHILRSGPVGEGRVPKVLILGLTFKENCPDVRNSKVLNLIRELSDYAMDVYSYDPLVDRRITETLFESKFYDAPNGDDTFDVLILAVAHGEFSPTPLRE